MGSVKRLVGFGAGGGCGQRCPRTVTGPCCPCHQPPSPTRMAMTAPGPLAVPGPHWAGPMQMAVAGWPAPCSAWAPLCCRHAAHSPGRPHPNCCMPSKASSKGRKKPQPRHPKERPLEKRWLLKALGLRALTAALLLETLSTFHQQKRFRQPQMEY